MGYSITLRTKTPALREQLVSFFEEWETLCAELRRLDGLWREAYGSTP